MEYFITDKYGVVVAVLNRIDNAVMTKRSELFKSRAIDEEWINGKFEIKRMKEDTIRYGDIIEHKDGGLYAIEIQDLDWFGDIKLLINVSEMGEFLPELPEDWFEIEEI